MYAWKEGKSNGGLAIFSTFGVILIDIKNEVYLSLKGFGYIVESL